jgi:hypothetical protein
MEVEMSTLGTDPSRSRFIMSTRDWSPLSEVAQAVSVATEKETELYVERLGSLYRWSLIHRGGAYPLLRITARFLQVDYQRIFIGFRPVGDGYSRLGADDPEPINPDAWAILHFDGPIMVDDVEARIRQELETVYDRT